jgi:hypothetical protein
MAGAVYAARLDQLSVGEQHQHGTEVGGAGITVKKLTPYPAMCDSL